MLKTLKITGIIAAALAVVFLVFSAVFGARGNDDIENFLDSPGAVENFEKAHGNNQKKDLDQTSPLVKQAQKFALFLNPPVAPRITAPVRTTGAPATPARPKTVSAKFKLIGTSFYPNNPEMSLALIDEPGKGFRWIRQSGKVGHLIIQQVKDGIVVVKDDQRTFEMIPERKPKKSLIRNPLLPSSKTPTNLTPQSLRNLPNLPSTAPAGRNLRNSKTAPNTNTHVGVSDEHILLDDGPPLGRPGDIEDSVPKNMSDEELREWKKRVMAELEFMSITTEEAEKLIRLGEDLAADRQTPQHPNSPQNE